MILTDTSIVIEWSRMPSLELARVLRSENPAVCGVTVAEMFAGVRSEPERTDVELTLRRFGHVPSKMPSGGLQAGFPVQWPGAAPKSSFRTQ